MRWCGSRSARIARAPAALSMKTLPNLGIALAFLDAVSCARVVS
jgi:hypothetical protein